MGFSHTFFSVDPLDNLEFWMHFHYLRLHVQIKYRCAYVSDWVIMYIGKVKHLKIFKEIAIAVITVASHYFSILS